jgi:hypothetical protein
VVLLHAWYLFCKSATVITLFFAPLSILRQPQPSFKILYYHTTKR